MNKENLPVIFKIVDSRQSAGRPKPNFKPLFIPRLAKKLGPSRDLVTTHTQLLSVFFAFFQQNQKNSRNLFHSPPLLSKKRRRHSTIIPKNGTGILHLFLDYTIMCVRYLSCFALFFDLTYEISS